MHIMLDRNNLVFCRSSAERIPDQVNEFPRLRWNMAPRNVIDIEWISLVRPVREQINEVPALEVMVKPQIDDLSDAETGEACAQLRFRIAYDQPPADRDRYDFASALKRPVKGTSGRMIDRKNALMGVACQILRPARSIVTFNVER